MKTTALIYGTPEQEQTVTIEFSGYIIDKWFGDRSTYFLTHLKVLDEINFRPSDAKCDVGIAIAEFLGMPVNDVKIECELFYSYIPAVIPIKHTYDNLILFI